MDELLALITQVVLTVVAGLLGTYGTMALSAIRKKSKAVASEATIAIIETAIASGMAYAKKEGLQEKTEAWLSTVLGYTRQSIPDTLASEGVKDSQLRKKVEAMAEDKLLTALGNAVDQQYLKFK